MKKYFRDFYGGSASIQIHHDGTATLRVSDGYGDRMVKKTYSSERGARIAMGKYSDGWEERK